MKNIIQNEDNGHLIADIKTIDDWDGFDLIIKFLIKYYNISIIEKIDGPESRIWKFYLDDKLIELHNNPYGNYFKVELLYKNTLQKVLKDLDDRLSG